MNTLGSPLQDFKSKLTSFARGERRGIRNPFVIAPVQPAAEAPLAEHLAGWDPDLPVTTVRLDRLMPKTPVFETVVSIPMQAFERGDTDTEERAKGRAAEAVERTLRDNLAAELIDVLLQEHGGVQNETEHLLLLLGLGSLYPFARASELFDELDRRRTRATIGMPFPGRIYGGKLSFFGEEARHYYPAHRIDDQITRAHLPADLS